MLQCFCRFRKHNQFPTSRNEGGREYRKGKHDSLTQSADAGQTTATAPGGAGLLAFTHCRIHRVVYLLAILTALSWSFIA